MEKRNDQGREREHAAGERGGKVREGIGKMLSNEEVMAESRTCDDAPPESGTHAAVEAHVAEIERRVGALVGDPALEEEGKAREEEGNAGTARLKKPT
jgi:uncharacterized protein YjbJ (UPF0337 family)